MKQYPYFIFTRTPLHIGAGQSVGYVDSPIQREIHTGIPVIPGTSIKGVLADLWTENGKRTSEGELLFGKGSGEKGAEQDSNGYVGSLLIGETRALLFPVRSAEGCFAWITCPLMLARYLRDIKNTAFFSGEANDTNKLISSIDKLGVVVKKREEKVTILAGKEISGNSQAVLEEYVFDVDNNAVGILEVWGKHFVNILSDDPVWKLLPGRLAIVPDGMFSFFVRNCCEVCQHVKIDDETGVAEDQGLFNQENCPSETLFYGIISEMVLKVHENIKPIEKLSEKIKGSAIQIGGNETTGLGWCSVVVKNH